MRREDRPIGVVDAVWSVGKAAAMPLLDGIRAAAETYNVSIVGGHTNAHRSQPIFSGDSGTGQASSDVVRRNARERLIAAIDLRGRHREPFANWEAATLAPPARLKGDLEVLPSLAVAGLAVAAKGRPTVALQNGCEITGPPPGDYFVSRSNNTREVTDISR